MTIYPKDVEKTLDSTPLEISKAKRTAMVTKAKELMAGKAIEEGDLANALEQYYVFEKNEHYTSAQLADIVAQVATDLTPAPVLEVEEV